MSQSFVEIKLTRTITAISGVLDRIVFDFFLGCRFLFLNSFFGTSFSLGWLLLLIWGFPSFLGSRDLLLLGRDLQLGLAEHADLHRAQGDVVEDRLVGENTKMFSNTWHKPLLHGPSTQEQELRKQRHQPVQGRRRTKHGPQQPSSLPAALSDGK